jgi:hypothetical protein
MVPIELGNVFNVQSLLGQLPHHIYWEAVSARLEGSSIEIENVVCCVSRWLNRKSNCEDEAGY